MRLSSRLDTYNINNVNPSYFEHFLCCEIILTNLKGHLLWNGATFLSRHIERNVGLVKGKNVLEFGAGAGLPSLVSGIIGAAKVIVTDYPDADLIENLQYNIDHCGLLPDEKASNDKDVVVSEVCVVLQLDWVADWMHTDEIAASLWNRLRKTAVPSPYIGVSTCVVRHPASG